MSVVAMSKIKLVSVNAYKEDILNALYRTGCVEISETDGSSDLFRAEKTQTADEIQNKYDRLSRIIDFFADTIERSKKESFYPKELSGMNGIIVSYDEFINAGKTEESVQRICDNISGLMEEYSSFKAARTGILNSMSLLTPYLDVDERFSDFKDTALTKVFFGTVKREDSDALTSALTEIGTASVTFFTDGATRVVLAVAHISDCDILAEKLLSCGFSACPFNGDYTAKETYVEYEKRLSLIESREREIARYFCENVRELKEIKILFDYYGFLLEREKDGENFSYTDSTFILEGFVPTDAVDKVKTELGSVTDAVFTEITLPEENENVPTLLKNNFVVKQTEFITDMYSTPSYKEKDPNNVVFFFFMLFMGLIMADIGYGIIMLCLGLALAGRIKVDNGSRRLWYNIAFGGIFAVIFGVLFNSLFGVSVLPFTVLPSPVPSIGGADGLMKILLACLGLGVLQLAVGYFMKALNEFKAGNILAGIFEGLLWVTFFVGFVLAAFNFLMGYLKVNVGAEITEFFDKTSMAGLILTGSSLVLIAIASGVKGKGFEKVSKPFGTFYGLINIFSDILSYARLFGLMLSGMIIAQTFNDIGSGMFSLGAAGYLLGGIVIVIGHVFNIAMGVLGAYIHDSRLQYIEFFGKFYTGEGNKFRPIGSNLKYVYVNKN